MSSRTLCTDCGAKRGLATYKDSTWCFSCSKKTTQKSIYRKGYISKKILTAEDKLDHLPPKALNYLYKYYYTLQDIEKYNIWWNERLQRIIFCHPQNKTAYWLRSLDPKNNAKWLFFGDQNYKSFYYYKDQTQLVIVEDVISAIRVAPISSVLCLGGTSLNKRPDLLEFILKHVNIVLAFDGDSAGRYGAYKLNKQLKLLREIKTLYLHKDPKDYTPTDLKSLLEIKE